MPTCIDLFAGCGGLSLGLEASGFSTIFAVEGHADPFATYTHNLLDRGEPSGVWPTWLERKPWLAEDLLSHHAEELSGLRGKVDLIAGGPPCQGFSLNGKRRPDDPRSRMVEVYLKYVEVIRPRLVLLENVLGFRSMLHWSGVTYSEYVKSELARLGYDAWFDILKASDWGVPQSRPRFILFAAPRQSLRGIDPFQRMRVGRKSFLAARDLGPGPTSAMAAISDLEEREEELPLDAEWGHLGFKSLTRSTEPTTAYQRLMRGGRFTQPSDMRLPRHGVEATRRMQDILLNCKRGVSIQDGDRMRFGLKKRSITPLDPMAPAPTITTLPDDLIHYSRPRSMSVREHARIQSFPDWFSFKGPYTTGGERRKTGCPRFTQVANAVPPLLAEAIGETLAGLLLVQKTDELFHLTKRVNMTREETSDRREISHGDVTASL